jgi:hypothetical protein
MPKLWQNSRFKQPRYLQSAGGLIQVRDRSAPSVVCVKEIERHFYRREAVSLYVPARDDRLRRHAIAAIRMACLRSATVANPGQKTTRRDRAPWTGARNDARAEVCRPGAGAFEPGCGCKLTSTSTRLLTAHWSLPHRTRLDVPGAVTHEPRLAIDRFVLLPAHRG